MKHLNSIDNEESRRFVSEIDNAVKREQNANDKRRAKELSDARKTIKNALEEADVPPWSYDTSGSAAWNIVFGKNEACVGLRGVAGFAPMLAYLAKDNGWHVSAFGVYAVRDEHERVDFVDRGEKFDSFSAAVRIARTRYKEYEEIEEQIDTRDPYDV